MTVRENIASRSGRYVSQPAGYQAFIPRPLPPVPSVRIDDRMLKYLSRADRALGRLDGSVSNLPNPDLFVFMYIRKEAVYSSQIEGTQASLTDVLELEAKVLEKDKAGDASDVVNYVKAMDYGLKRLETLPLSLRLIREIHKILLKGVRGGKMDPGEFRKSQNWVGPQGCSLMEATYVPPPVHEMKLALSDFETFLHLDSPLPPLIKIGLAHGQFETIHPFIDGNGRIGRLLITFLLCREDILSQPLLYLSHHFKKQRSQYYEKLQAIRDDGEWEGWILFFLQGIYEVSRDAAETARRILSMREKHREEIIKNFGSRSGNAVKLLEHLYWSPIISIAFVRKLTGLAYGNANNLVGRFEKMGLLTEITGQKRNRKYSYKPYLELFND